MKFQFFQRVQTISHTLKQPKQKKEFQSLLGILYFVRKNIAGYGELTNLLNKLLTKNLGRQQREWNKIRERSLYE
jgi:hypothetical protein